MPRKPTTRRTFLKLSAAAASVSAAEARAREASRCAHLPGRIPLCPLQHGEPVQWAIGKLQDALHGKRNLHSANTQTAVGAIPTILVTDANSARGFGRLQP